MQVQAEHVAACVLPRQARNHLARHVARFRHRRVLDGAAVVDFIASDLHTRQLGPRASRQFTKARLRLEHRFGGFEQRDQWQQAQAGAVAVNALRVDQRLAQHLQPAAHAQHGAALRGVRSDGAVQALFAHPFQVRSGGFGAGQHHPVTDFEPRQIGRAARPQQAHTSNVLERLEFIQDADARVSDHGDGGVHFARCHTAVVKHPIFFRQAVLPPHRDGGHRRHAGQLLQHLRRRRQQGCVAAKLVEYKTANQRSLFLWQQRPGAVQVGKGAAPVDVGDQQAARLGIAGDAHVDDVAGMQVDFCR